MASTKDYQLAATTISEALSTTRQEDEALQTATINPVRVLGMADSLGTVEPGKLADLVLLDANPLDNIRNRQQIHAVVADGQLYRRADLDKLLIEW